MNISNQVSFKSKFVNNQAFRDVVKFAADTGQLNLLDTALNKIDNAIGDDILLIHGKTPNGIYSNFTVNGRSIRNPSDVSPELTSLLGIIDLSELSLSYRQLFGRNAKLKLTANDIINKYSTKA